jgi:hypothetical protein
MRKFFFSAITILSGLVSSLTTSIAQQAQVPIADPAQFSTTFIKQLETSGAEAVSEIIGRAVGNPAGKAALTPHLIPFEKKSSKMYGIASDVDFNGFVRVIIVYTYGLIDQSPYLYFRFTFKNSPEGWLLTNFNFKTEPQEAFPAEFLPYARSERK